MQLPRARVMWVRRCKSSVMQLLPLARAEWLRRCTEVLRVARGSTFQCLPSNTICIGMILFVPRARREWLSWCIDVFRVARFKTDHNTCLPANALCIVMILFQEPHPKPEPWHRLRNEHGRLTLQSRDCFRVSLSLHSLIAGRDQQLMTQIDDSSSSVFARPQSRRTRGINDRSRGAEGRHN